MRRVDLQPHPESVLFEHKDRLTRSDLWAWRDAVDRLAPPIAPPRRDGAVDAHFERIVAEMSNPAFYPGAPAVEVRETHISWVFLAGPRAYKLKKPVVLPFLDYGSVEQRRAMCEHEVALNQRLAAGVYLAVRAIVDRDGRLQLGSPGPDAIEHVVEMRRFDEARTLAAMVRGGRGTAEVVAAVGGRLAAFHAEAPPCRAGEDVLVAVERVADANFESLLAGVGALAHARLFAAQRFAVAFVAGHAATLVARAAGGRVREGHGDLRAEHVLIGDALEVVDCVEFDAELRTVDVGADLAFLVMDLARLGRPDLGRVLVDAYRHAGGDPGSDELIAFHAAVRAWIRAKLALPPVNGARTSPAGQTDTQDEALELFALGERFAWQARLPLTLIVCGPPASGKSELAGRLSEVSGLAVIGSDETRKRLSGLEPSSRAPQEAYSAAATARTYAELGRRVATQLGVSGGAIVDATFARRSARQAFSAACVGLAEPLVFECRAPAAVMQARARTRAADPQHVSDAGPETAARLRQRQRFEPLEDDVPAARHFVVRTDQPVASAVEDVITMLDRRLAEPPPPRPLDATRRSL